MITPPGRLAVTDRPVEQLGPADLDACLALTLDRQWVPEPGRWELLLETAQVFAVRDEAGLLAGSVVLTAYGPRLAAIGMMLVAPRHERQGLGRALMAHALAASGSEVTMLYATTAGRPLYERIGFQSAGPARRYIGRLPGRAGGPAAPAPRPATADDLTDIAELDRHAFGGDRAALLARLPGLAEGFLVMDRPAGRSDPAGRAIRGFAASTPLTGALQIGPVIAGDLATATALIACLAGAADLPIRIDVPARHPGLISWLDARGVPVVSETTIMTYGGGLPGIPEHLFAPFNVAIG